jgi:Zn-dependent M28 family amino/carboxypeptidase
VNKSLISCAVLLVAGVAALAVAPRQTAHPSTLIDSAQLLSDLKVLSADDMQGRQVDTPGGAKARAFVIDRFKASGIQPFGESYTEPFTFASGRGGTQTERHGINVVGHIDGTNTRRFIVVSAHYDHIGTRNGVVFNGADDNASGTAALFAVAKYFSAHRPANSLLFVAFDGEESGLRGSEAFVKQPPVDAHAMAIDLNMDMIGRDPNDKLFVVGTYLQPFLKPLIEKLAVEAPVKVLIGHDDPTQKNVEDWTKDSDHYAFLTAKIPALYFGVEDFDQHHKATDDYETITFDFYIRAVETMVDAVKVFDANLDSLPRS